jgi:hypothetical protein
LVEITRTEVKGGTHGYFDYKTYFKAPSREYTADFHSIQVRFMVSNWSTESLVCNEDRSGLASNLVIESFTSGDACSAEFKGPWLVMHKLSDTLHTPMAIGDHTKSSTSADFCEKRHMEEWKDVNMRDVRIAADSSTAAWLWDGKAGCFWALC